MLSDFLRVSSKGVGYGNPTYKHKAIEDYFPLVIKPSLLLWSKSCSNINQSGDFGTMTLTKNDLIEALYVKTDLTKKQAAGVVENLIELIPDLQTNSPSPSNITAGHPIISRNPEKISGHNRGCLYAVGP